MSALAKLRARLRLRQRLRDPEELKHDAELRWWLEHWAPVVRDGGFHPGDALELLGGEAPAATYDGRRQQQARAEVRRVLREAAIEDEGFFAGKVVLDIGPGPLGFPDACPARVSIGIDPLAERYRAAGLMIEGSDAIYITGGASGSRSCRAASTSWSRATASTTSTTRRPSCARCSGCSGRAGR